MTPVTRTARRMMIVVGEDATYGNQPLFAEILQRAHDHGLAGGSAFRGIEGFGSSGELHTTRILDLAENLPVMIVIVDRPEVIELFLTQLEELGVRGVVALDDVDVLASE